MKIKELKVGMSNVNIKAKVAKLNEPREVMTRFGTATSVTRTPSTVLSKGISIY